MPVAGAGIQVLLESAQTMVFNPDILALHFAGAVAALIHQHTQHLTAANLRQIADLAWLPDLQWPSQSRHCRERQQQQAQRNQ